MTKPPEVCKHEKTLAVYTHQYSGHQTVTGVRCCVKCRKLLRLEEW